MNSSKWIVTLFGLAAIGWVNWYFFAAGKGRNRSGGTADGQDHARHH